MAIPFRKPDPPYRFKSPYEIAALDAHFAHRKVPQRRDGRLLLASWNIANLGVQKRTPSALKIIAHVLKRFELIAVQEVNEKFRTFAKIVELMGPHFDYVMTDTAGNAERLAFVFDKRKVTPTNLFGELALRPREYPKHTVKVRYRENGEDKIDIFPSHRFVPFDRNPFLGSFRAGKVDVTLANCHLYFGKFQDSKKREERERYARRVLEIFALAKWAGRRVNKDATYDKDIILLGDMNLPSMAEDESTYRALVKFGFLPLDYVNHTTKTGGSNLGNDKTYDQMAFAPGPIRRRIKGFGAFDFDKAVFSGLWEKLSDEMSPKRALSRFNSHVKYHLSDHRPLWVELKID